MTAAQDIEQPEDKPMLLIAYVCPPLAYDLHLFGPGKCSRRGGRRICDPCIYDLYAPALGFTRHQARSK